jgi:hypothetical protein
LLDIIVKPFPNKYRVLSEDIPLSIPGFSKHFGWRPRVLAPVKIESEQWFISFAERVSNAINRKYFPVCRLADGEYRFLFGAKPVSKRYPLHKRIQLNLYGMIRTQLKGGSFHGLTLPQVSVGDYTGKQRREVLPLLGKNIKFIGDHGILAFHLSIPPRPSDEHYYPALGKWLKKNNIMLTLNNYVPFYFVYALLRGPEKRRLICGMRILIVHSATGDKQERIGQSLLDQGAQKVLWLHISRNKSLFDKIDITDYVGKVDICFIGAGVGKPNIIAQLSELNVPCIDAGFVFEIWADEEAKWKRAVCVPDEEFDVNKIQFLPPDMKEALLRTTNENSSNSMS